MNMKKIVICLALISVFGIGTGFIIVFLTGGFSLSSSENPGFVSVADVQTQKMEGITEVIIEGAAADIHIIPEKREDVKVQLHGKIISSDFPKMEVLANGNQMIVKVKEIEKVQAGFFSSDLRLDVSLPKDYRGDLKIESMSGDIEVQEELDLTNISIRQISGDTRIRNLKAQNLNFESVSGDLVIMNTFTEDTRIQVTSGDVDIKNFEGNLKGKSTSGDFHATFLTFGYDIHFEAVSGDIDIDLPDDAAFFLNAEALLGDIQCNFPVTIYEKNENKQLKGVVKNESNKIALHVTSGDIIIR